MFMIDFNALLSGNLHYYILMVIGLFVWSAKYVSSPKHKGLLSNGFEKEFIFVRGLTPILFCALCFLIPTGIILAFFALTLSQYILIISSFIVLFLAYLIILTVIKNHNNPKIYHNIYFISKKQTPLIKVRLIEEDENKFIIWNEKNKEFNFIQKKGIKKIEFYKEEIEKKFKNISNKNKNKANVNEKLLEGQNVIAVLTWSIALLTSFLSAEAIIESSKPVLTIILGLCLFLVSIGIMLKTILSDNEDIKSAKNFVIVGVIGVILVLFTKHFLT